MSMWSLWARVLRASKDRWESRSESSPRAGRIHGPGGANTGDDREGDHCEPPASAWRSSEMINWTSYAETAGR
jgi:hypothetical protein